MSIKFAREFQICVNNCTENQASKSLTLERIYPKKLKLSQKMIKIELTGSPGFSWVNEITP